MKLFRQTRQRLAEENKPGQYLRYAIGEIVLVVIGILIALQINNWNEAKISRDKELHYLSNIQSDLYLNIANIDGNISRRNDLIHSANIMLEHFEGKPITDISALNFHAINVYTWQRFFQINNTFIELTNSGTLALISNDSIKGALLELDSQYKKLKAEEDHFRFDTENLLYKPLYRILDLNPAVINYTFRVTDGQAGENLSLDKKQYYKLLKDIEHKNGFVMTVYELSVMNGELAHMKTISENLIDLIESEMNLEK